MVYEGTYLVESYICASGSAFEDDDDGEARDCGKMQEHCEFDR